MGCYMPRRFKIRPLGVDEFTITFGMEVELAKVAFAAGALVWMGASAAVGLVARGAGAERGWCGG